ncbi:hypothetical protein [Blautia massiliensis (ex Durand et al. 2017)]|jgi:hypothetical protein|uniref:hypothetical protein n=1 Tax=Blautia massiliensis (ex Durand et al. 2017) TaxID=1737424 RepID=UPI0022E35619|nr:hypothetical protein [Blautia massiliensis (ex Durand et al. 2017)]
MKKNTLLYNFNTGKQEYSLVEYASVCPFCNHVLSPTVLYASLIEYDDYEKNKVSLLNYCSNCDNEFMSSHSYDPEDDGYLCTSTAPAQFVEHVFSDKLQSLSPQFVKTYNESLHAESLDLTSICGMGYRKALEFLIKDYAISKNPDSKSIIEQLPLSKCIDTYIPEDRLKTLAKASAWLGNDQTHYVQKHSTHGLKELKQFINAFVTFIDADLAFQDAALFISGSSN